MELGAIRTGIGVDVHAFAAPDSERPCWLACLQWENELGLEGHSDADVAAHAVCDAVLSACGLGDLGQIFGTDKPQWAGASGATLIKETGRLAAAAGFQIGNVVVQVIGERPRLQGRRQEAETMMSAALGGTVNLSATTTDHLGFLGRKEGLAAIATALVFRQAKNAKTELNTEPVKEGISAEEGENNE